MKGGKVAVITGASSGIGWATALAFAQRGVNVVGTGRRADRLRDLERAALDMPGVIIGVVADVSDPRHMHIAVQKALARFGRVDIVVANAGVGHRGALVDSRWTDLDTLVRTNIDGLLHTLRAGVQGIRQHGEGGHVVIVSSVTFNMTAPYTAAYAASKAFASSIARSLRMELAPEHIRVTDMRVGRTETGFNAQRLGDGPRRDSGLPVMRAERVAHGIVRTVLDRPRRKQVTLRWIDRLIILANRLLPGVIGRRARAQYR